MNKALINIKRKKKGFTLLELIISIGILSIVVIPLSNLVIGTFRMTNNAKIKQEATNIAQKYMEKIKADDSIKLDKIIDEEETFPSYGYPSSENGYSISYSINKEEDYYLPHESYSGVDSNTFDYKFKLPEEGELVNIYDNNGQINSHSITSDLGMQITINNRKYDEITNQNQITYEINGYTKTPINKTKANNENIYIRIDVNRDDLTNPLVINAKNECSGQLIFYFVKSDKLTEDVQCKVINEGGNIVKYENIYNNTSSIPKSRLYKIRIEVEKNDEKVVNESYKTVY